MTTASGAPLTIAVIPARYASTRFPGKPLALLAGKPMLEHVHARCVESGAFSRIVIATDDARIEAAAKAFGAEVQMTSLDCETGTDRVAEVARALGLRDEDVLVNVQGDEPLIEPDALKALASAFTSPDVQMATLVRPLLESERAQPNVVKAVLAQAQPGNPGRRALYFSRADLPFQRDTSGPAPERFGHLGLYGYRKATLLRLASLPPSPLENTEKLEQLRALEAGISIHCYVTDFPGLGVDTPEDLERAQARLSARR